MMNERMKILEMLSEGKITPEQAEQLLQALEGKQKRGTDRSGDRFSFSEFKNIGNQVSAAVAQSLGDVKRVVEQQLDQWSFSGNHLSVSHQLTVPADVVQLSVETVNGKIQVTPWDEPYAKIEVRAMMRTHHLSDAKRSLERALQINHQEERYELVIHHSLREAGQVAMNGAHVDVYIPTQIQKLHARTKNGAIYTDSVSLEDFHVETTNGSIGLYHSAVTRLHAETDNGGVDVQGMKETCKNVYVFTRNGTITFEGIPTDIRVMGTARTGHGRIDVRHPAIQSEFDDLQRRTFARLHSITDTDETAEGTRMHLETKNGSIRIRD